MTSEGIETDLGDTKTRPMTQPTSPSNTASSNTAPSKTAPERAEIPIFLIDAALAATIGVLLATSAVRLHALSGGGLEPETLRLVGLALLPWSVHNWLTSKQKPLRLANFCVHCAVDSFWILASLWLYAQHFRSLTWFGHVLYGPQITTVALVLFTKVHVFRSQSAAASA